MSTALTITPGNTPLSITETRRSANQMVAQRAAIVDCMSSVMRKDHDYGVIPGTGKPSLYKPGSEKLLAMFNLAAQPAVEDLGTPDCFRYRVIITVIHTPTGTVVGYGVGEASSAESKYQWRAVVCEEEWEATPEDRRRLKWKKGYQGSSASSARQVRAEMEDVAPTILKMAKKRAQIDAVLTTTAASDVFAQDVEDLVAAGLDLPPDATELPTGAPAPLPQELQRKTDAPPAQLQQQQPQPQAQRQQTTQWQAAPPQSRVRLISGPQASRFWAVAMQYHKDHTKITGYLHNVLGVQKKDDIPVSCYDEAIAWAEGKED